MKTDTTYNGWANYATWRVNLEMIDGWAEYHTEAPGYETFEEVYQLADHLKDYCIEVLENQTIEGRTTNANLVMDYALAFLDDVDWREIAMHLVESYPQLMKANRPHSETCKESHPNPDCN